MGPSEKINQVLCFWAVKKYFSNSLNRITSCRFVQQTNLYWPTATSHPYRWSTKKHQWWHFHAYLGWSLPRPVIVDDMWMTHPQWVKQRRLYSLDWSNNWDSENSNPVIHRFFFHFDSCPTPPICFNHPPFFFQHLTAPGVSSISGASCRVWRIPNHHSQLPNPWTNRAIFHPANWEGTGIPKYLID